MHIRQKKYNMVYLVNDRFKSYDEGTNLTQTDGKAIKIFKPSVLNLKKIILFTVVMLEIMFL